MAGQGLSRVLLRRTGRAPPDGRPRRAGPPQQMSYDRGVPTGSTIPRDLIEQQRARHATIRSFGAQELNALLELLSLADEVVTIDEARTRKDEVKRIIGLRHDVDHDLETALAFARLEAELGYRASYYVLHTDWYYRADVSGPPSAYLLDACRELVSMGHEVALHNNAIAAAIQLAEAPEAILRRELDYLRAAGFTIEGSVAHGDELCHRAGFINSEVFTECSRPKLGAPDRTIVYENEDTLERREVKLSPAPMADFGLSYEAGYVRYDHYLSDSGGVWQSRFDEARNAFDEAGGFLQILAHPVWWALAGENYVKRELSVVNSYKTRSKLWETDN
jgi:hypothetical protein